MNETDVLDFEAMRNIDIRAVDPTTLVDIRDIKVDPAIPQPERMAAFVRQIKNPYCFRCGDMVVKISYADTTITMEERMEGFFRTL